MTSASIAAGHVDRLIEIERREAPVSVARQIVARRVGLSVSAVEDLQRGRKKSVCADLFRRIHNAFVGALEAEIGRANHEIQMARQCGLEPHSFEMARLQAAVDEAQKLIAGK